MKTIEFDYDFTTPTRREAVHGYIESFTTRDIHYAEHIAASISQQNNPLAEYVVLIPVAAHQEADNIEPAMAQYARQQSNVPFSVILGLNSPLNEKENSNIEATTAAVDRSKRHHPDLDIRVAMTYYGEPVIGEIRRDLWNGTLLSAMDTGTYLYDDDEMIGINHDIDLVSMSPRYIQRIQHHYAGRRRAYTNAGMKPVPFSPRATILKHAPSPTHPNISKGAYWIDFMTRQMNGPYEASLIIPFSHYADRGGFQSDAVTHETAPLVNFTTGAPPYIPGTTMQTSPRRYIDRLRYGYDKIWTTETFGPHDQCRSTDKGAQDITQPELESIITKSYGIRGTVAAIATRAIDTALLKTPEFLQELTPYDEINDWMLEKQMNDIINKKITLTTAVLERIITSPKLANQARSLAIDYDYKDEIARQFFCTD